MPPRAPTCRTGRWRPHGRQEGEGGAEVARHASSRDDQEQQRPDPREEQGRRGREPGDHRNEEGGAEHGDDVLHSDAGGLQPAQPLLGRDHISGSDGSAVTVDLPAEAGNKALHHGRRFYPPRAQEGPERSCVLSGPSQRGLCAGSVLLQTVDEAFSAVAGISGGLFDRLSGLLALALSLLGLAVGLGALVAGELAYALRDASGGLVLVGICLSFESRRWASLLCRRPLGPHATERRGPCQQTQGLSGQAMGIRSDNATSPTKNGRHFSSF